MEIVDESVDENVEIVDHGNMKIVDENTRNLDFHVERNCRNENMEIVDENLENVDHGNHSFDDDASVRNLE